MKKAITLLLAFVLVATTFIACGGGAKPINKTPEETVDITMKLLSGESLSKTDVRKMQSEDCFAYMEKTGTSFSTYYSNVQKQGKINANAIVSVFGKDFTYSYVITANQAMSSDEELEATKHLHSEEWYDAKNLNGSRSLTVEISISGEKDSGTYVANIQVMQYGEGWYLLTLECDELYAILG